MRQYTVKEYDKWEGKTFDYVLMLSDEQVSQIRNKLDKFEEIGEEFYIDIFETDITDRDIELLNHLSENNYMPLVGAYKLKENAIEDWKEINDLFYKGTGLIPVASVNNLV